MQAKVDLLMSKVAAAKNRPIDATRYFIYLSFDVMADVGKSCTDEIVPPQSIRLYAVVHLAK